MFCCVFGFLRLRILHSEKLMHKFRGNSLDASPSRDPRLLVRECCTKSHMEYSFRGKLSRFDSALQATVEGNSYVSSSRVRSRQRTQVQHKNNEKVQCRLKIIQNI